MVINWVASLGMDSAGTTIMSGAYGNDQPSSNGGSVYFFTNTFTNTNTTGTGPYGTSISNLNLRRGSVIEEVAGICDGRIVRAESGVYEMPLVTAPQAASTSFQTLLSQKLLTLLPWNKRVKYNLQVKLYAIVNSGISSYKLFVDDVEVTKFRNSRAFNYGHMNTVIYIKILNGYLIVMVQRMMRQQAHLLDGMALRQYEWK